MALDPYDAPDPKRLLDQGTKGQESVVIPDVPDPGMVDVDTPHRGDDVSLVPLGFDDFEEGDEDVGEVELAEPIDALDAPERPPHDREHDSGPLPVPVFTPAEVESSSPDVETAPVEPDPFAGFEDLEPVQSNANLKLGMGLAVVGLFVMLAAVCLFGLPALLNRVDPDASARTEPAEATVAEPSPAAVAPPIEVEPPANPAPFAIEPEPAAPAEPTPAPAEPVPPPPEPDVKPSPAPVRPKPRPRPRPKPRPVPKAPGKIAPEPVPSAPAPAPAPSPAPAPQPAAGSPWDTPE